MKCVTVEADTKF